VAIHKNVSFPSNKFKADSSDWRDHVTHSTGLNCVTLYTVSIIREILEEGGGDSPDINNQIIRFEIQQRVNK
jgi:hypothetical protein